MKKSLLLLCLAAVAFTQSATAGLTKIWSQDNSLLGEKAYNAPAVFDKDGNIVAAMPVKDTPGVQIIVYSKADGSSLRVSNIEGALNVSAITMDNENNVYIAGTFADELIAQGQSSADNSITLEGMKIEGDFTVEKNASFIIKYNAQGNPVASSVFIPEVRPEYASSLDPAPAPGTVYFAINHIKASEGKVYASAVYTGIAKPADGTFSSAVTFDSGFNSLWGGLFINDLKACTVFCLDSDLKNGSVIADAKVRNNLETDEDQYQALSVAFDVVGSDVYAAFVGYGDLVINNAGQAVDFAPSADNRDVIFNYAVYNDKGLAKKLASKAYPEANKNKSNVISNVIVDAEANVYGVGNVHTEVDEVQGVKLLVDVIKSGSNEIASFAKEFVNGTVSSEEVACSAVLPSGDLVLGAFNYYNQTATEHKGEFAESVSVYSFNGSDLAASDLFDSLIGVAVQANNVAASTVYETGATLSLYNDPDAAGIDDVMVSDANAPVHYYNLQGMRVDNPAAGTIVIRRQGAQTSKILVK